MLVEILSNIVKKKKKLYLKHNYKQLQITPRVGKIVFFYWMIETNKVATSTDVNEAH